MKACACRLEGATPAPAEEEAEEEEPEWELPEELREYLGDPADRKAMLSFRQAQAAARQARPRSAVASCQALGLVRRVWHGCLSNKAG